MRLGQLTILNTALLSNEIDVAGIESLTFYGPAALTNVVTVQASPDKGVTWFPTATVITALAITKLAPVEANRLRLSSALAEGADRVIDVHGTAHNVNA